MKKLPCRSALFVVPVLIGILCNVALADKQTKHPKKKSANRSAKASKVKKSKPKPIVRIGSVVEVNRKTVDQYVYLHNHVWPEILKRIRKSKIRNYSIYMGELNDGKLYLFSYFEYIGNDFDADMAAIGNDPITREWWKLTDPLQKRIKGTPTGSQWKPLDEVFHTD